MQRQTVDEQRDEGPRLLGIPTPVAAPRDVGPHGTKEDAGGQEEDGVAQQTATEDADDEEDVGHHDDADVDDKHGRTQHGYQRTEGDGDDHVGGQQDGDEPEHRAS